MEDSSTTWIQRILFALSIPFSFFITQHFAGYDLTWFWHFLLTVKGLTGLFLYAMLAFLFYIITNRTKWSAILLVLVGTAFGLANYFLMSFRGVPLMLADLFSVGTAKDVAAHYEYSVKGDALASLIMAAVYLFILLSVKGHRGLQIKKRSTALAGFVLALGISYLFLWQGKFLANQNITLNVWEPDRDYFENGSLLSFFISCREYRNLAPRGYSADKAAEIARRYESDAPLKEGEKKPNLIVIMNEAFSDLSVNGEIPTSEDPLKHLHKLKKNTSKGNLLVSVVGGNTANSEFEYLSGCTMGFLPFRSIPYDSYIKTSVPSQATAMKENGYGGLFGFHPGQPTAWSRDEVYEYFGFEKIAFEPNLEEPEILRGFVSDRADFDYLVEQYEKTKENDQLPFYAFNVTIQNHSGYQESMGVVETPLKITDSELYDPEVEQYLNLVKLSDEAFSRLCTYFEEQDEPTVIVMFGDHQPSFQSNFFERLAGTEKNKTEFSEEEAAIRYTVPYVIWANYDIPEEEKDMSLNYLSAYVTDLLDLPLTGYQKFLLELQKQVPQMNANGYLGADGKYYSYSDYSEYSYYLKEYQYLQYNNLFDTDSRVESLYHLNQR